MDSITEDFMASHIDNLRSATESALSVALWNWRQRYSEWPRLARLSYGDPPNLGSDVGDSISRRIIVTVTVGNALDIRSGALDASGVSRMLYEVPADLTEETVRKSLPVDHPFRLNP